MKNLIEELYAICKANNLTARKTDTSLFVYGWGFQLRELGKLIRDKGFELVENSIGGHYYTLTARQGDYRITLEFE